MPQNPTVKVKPNKKVKNATPKVYKGKTYRSELEVYCAEQLDLYGVVFQYEENKFVLQDKFKSPNISIEPFETKGVKKFEPLNTNIRAICYTPDFVDPGLKWVIEVKGHRTNEFDIKWKMFKSWLSDNMILADLYLPTNRKQVLYCVQLIKNKLNVQN